jgi:hypothetical protein
MKQQGEVVCVDSGTEHLQVLKEEAVSMCTQDSDSSEAKVSVEAINDTFPPPSLGSLRTETLALPFSDTEFENLKSKYGKFSTIMSIRVLHFLPPDELRKSLQQIHDLLEDGGRFFVLTETCFLGVLRDTFYPEYLRRVGKLVGMYTANSDSASKYTAGTNGGSSNDGPNSSTNGDPPTDYDYTDVNDRFLERHPEKVFAEYHRIFDNDSRNTSADSSPWSVISESSPTEFLPPGTPGQEKYPSNTMASNTISLIQKKLESKKSNTISDSNYSEEPSLSDSLWPGYIQNFREVNNNPDPEVTSRLPQKMNLLDTPTLRRELELAGFDVEVCDYLDRRSDTPEFLHWIGRESVGAVGVKRKS